jgi:hypothetical protein
MKHRVAWGLVVLVGCGALLYARLTSLDLSPFNDRSFQREVWLTGRGPQNPRGQMLDDLLHTHLEKGMLRTATVQMLGQPDEMFNRTTAKQYLGLRDDELGRARKVDAYGLGRWGAVGKGDDRLLLLFDADGRLVDVRHIDH